MAMAVDNRQQLGAIQYEHMRFAQPTFTNPWASGTAAPPLYAPSVPQVAVNGDQHAAQTMRAPGVSMAYHSGALPAPSMPSGIQPLDPVFQQPGLQAQDYAHAPRSYGAATYPAATTSVGNGYGAPTSAPQYTGDYKYAYQDRRSSHPSVATNLYEEMEAQKHRQSSLIDFNSRMHSSSEAERNSFSDALDASRGMVAMSQDITPRNIYGNQGSSRSSSDSYGFPTAHSAHSSISSASTYPSYYNSSVSEASYGDYSSANESVDVPSRTLPPPNGLIGVQMPPAPQSHMMGQFSSKVSTSSQKKHKCKVCDKRFTRPSSLQTHMYSHTGEKPFACNVEGCGRHFSVVSNLRRHRKVHKGEADHPSPDDE